MEFSDAAAYFDQDEVFDAYTGESLFFAHTTPHDDHTSAGSTSRRRTLIAAVDTVAPARRAIRWYDTYWVVGDNNTDAFQGTETRRSFGLKKSSGLVNLITPGQACLAQAGAISFHAHLEYYRDMTDAMTSSEYDVMWNVFCPSGEPVTKGAFLTWGALLLRVRETYTTVDDFLVAEADQFDTDARQSAVFTQTSGLDFDTQSSASSTVAVIQTDVSKFYLFRAEAEAGMKPGDRTVFVAKSAITPAVGNTFTMLGVNWRVVIVAGEGDSWALRARLA